jgi:hypothetical protein
MYFLKKYIVLNKLMSIIASYLIASIFLKFIFSIDILIPCIWKTIFHIECLGCGLTRAFIALLYCNFIDAFNENPLIFIVLPAGIFYFYFDFAKFKRKLKNAF